MAARLLNSIVVLFLVVCVLFPTNVGGEAAERNIAQTVAQPTPTLDPLLEKYIDALGRCESGNNPSATNWHDGYGPDTPEWDKPSYGEFQWKLSSSKAYLQKFGMWQEHWEQEDHINFLYSDGARTLTRNVLVKDRAWKNWYTCSIKTNLHTFIHVYKDDGGGTK